MTTLLVAEQLLNGLQLGMMLFLIAAGLTLVFGIMDMINLAHGSFYMLGAYFTATLVPYVGFFPALVMALPLAAAVGLLVESTALRRLYRRDHLDQVLATFGLILFFNEAVRMTWGPAPIFLQPPESLSGTVEIIPGAPYPAYRLAIILAGAAVAAFLWWLITRTRVGMLIRAGASDREMATALGVNINGLYTLVFGLGCALAALAGGMAGPLFAVQVGMGDNILILTFVVIVIGGVGSVRGALVGALLVGVIDTLGRAFLPTLFRLLADPSVADSAGAALASMAVYVAMAAVLAVRPKGLFPAHG